MVGLIAAGRGTRAHFPFSGQRVFLWLSLATCLLCHWPRVLERTGLSVFPQVDTASEVEELEADSISLLPAASEGSRGGARIQVFLARYRWVPQPAPHSPRIGVYGRKELGEDRGPWRCGVGVGLGAGVSVGRDLLTSLRQGVCSEFSTWLMVDNQVSVKGRGDRTWT